MASVFMEWRDYLSFAAYKMEPDGRNPDDIPHFLKSGAATRTRSTTPSASRLGHISAIMRTHTGLKSKRGMTFLSTASAQKLCAG